MYEIIGYKKVRYNRKSDGKLIEGTEYYLAGESDDPNITGRECLTAYISNGTAVQEFHVGDTVKINYNRWGRIDDLIPMD